MADISGELSELISKSEAFTTSDNIRVGRYKFLVKRIFAEKVNSGRFAFAEFKVLESNPNPQVLPPGVPANKFDSGANPNLVGSSCAMKVNFDGPGAKSAPGNVKAFVLGLFGKNQSETNQEEVDGTWRDLARQKDLKVGDAVGINPTTNQPILADKAKRANPGCGMVIYCTASMKEKQKTKLLPPEQKEFITFIQWECAGKPGTGENAAELVAKRRSEIENAAVEDDDTPVVAAVSAPPAPPAPTAPTVFSPAAPWVAHPSMPPGATPETRWYWSNPKLGGNNAVKNEIQLRNGA